MEIFKANAQWQKRPADERFPNLKALYDVTRDYAEHAREKEINWTDLRVEDRTGDLMLVGKANIPARLTNWAFGQMCARVGAPASYLRDLPATLVAQNLNHGLKNRNEDQKANCLFHSNGDLVLRAVTSDKYARIWNWEIAERLLELESQGWVPATPDIRVLEEGQTALYASDHDMFAFIRMDNRTIEGSGDPNRPIYKGLIVSQLEVGAAGLSVCRFLYNSMCGNHIIWGASEVVEINLRHIGNIRDKFKAYHAAIKEYADESVSDVEAKIKKAKETIIGSTKEEVLDAIFGKRNLGLTRKLISAGYEACVIEEDGEPNTAWGIVAGLTRFSQQTPYADERTAIDKGAAKILEAF